MPQHEPPQPNTGPTCAICGVVILPRNDITRKLFASGKYDNAPGFLCAGCHRGQRELYPTGPNWYERLRGKLEAKDKAIKRGRR